jgi:uncharacterized protein
MTLSSPSVVAPKSPPKPFILGVIVLALSAPLITWILDGYFDAWFDRNGSVLAGLLSFWLIVGLVLLLTGYEAQPPQTTTPGLWRSIGFKRVKLRESLIVLIVGFITLGFANVAFVVLSRTIFPTEINMSRVVTLPLPLVILAFLTGMFAEEILYRGYALERLQRITGNWWISGAITWALFVGFHVPAYPMAHIVGYVAPASVVITLVYIWKRNLTYTVMIHGILNLPILLAVILMPLLQIG